ncbi:penicillin-binding protein 1C [Rheinheimera pacifica]|uniref:penicillin-binding protein 1C n=1 Tax=Rheinheimera pacifica TaxID=173990 RepID=UPI002166FF8D|nr:penicillin-binding protein 1C [Rheinheimera pacifica]MCS4307377.1 penicillin-binding protein 1C [Rheinheimera pacifica]
MQHGILKKRAGRVLALAAVILLLPLLALLLSPKPALYGRYLQSSAYFAAGGELLSLRLAADQRYRLRLPLADIAPALQQATLLYEDRQFYHHFGVDISAVGRAFWQSVVKGGRRQGASTISMQLARLRFEINTSSLSGKLQQLVYALYLERHFSKHEILEAYFNYAPYGGNIEGVAAASLIYFGKEAQRLTVAEALALSVIPQNPNQRSPLSTKGEQQLELARQRLAALWLQYYPATEPGEAQRLSLPLTFYQRADLAYAAPHFINQLQAQGQIEGRFYTSLQYTVQQRMQRGVTAYLRRNADKGFNNASVLLVKRSTMQVQAWIGSADFYNAAISGQVDGVTALRSPGSALKPFVYALALQQGVIHPQSLLTDLPRRYGSFNPENFDRQFVGPVNATEALINSRNVPAVQLQASLTKPDFYHWLKQAQVPLTYNAEHYGLALVLGGMELSMQQLVQLYAMLGNGGNWQALQWQAEPAAAAPQPLLSPEAAFLTLDMLRQHAKPQVGLLSELTDSTPVAWKTGTSYAFRDAWSVALSGDYVLAVWLGNFDGSSNPNLIGRTAAGPLLFELLAMLLRDKQAEQSLFSAGNKLNLKQVALCSRSGELPNKYCPQTRPGWFIPGVSPIKVSDVHRAVPVYADTGLRACNHQPPQTELKVFEFWPSDIARAYQLSGIVLTPPPAYQHACIDQPQSSQQAPQIRSPQQALTYQLGKNAEQQKIALQASFDGAVTTAHWFIDSRYLGSVKPGETLFWQGETGEFQLRVVDDLGGVASLRLRVQ